MTCVQRAYLVGVWSLRSLPAQQRRHTTVYAFLRPRSLDLRSSCVDDQYTWKLVPLPSGIDVCPGGGSSDAVSITGVAFDS